MSAIPAVDRRYLFFLLFIFFCSLFVYQLRVTGLTDALDPSWQYSLNYATTHHLNYGNDVVFTYGPLGFIGYLVNAGLSVPLIVLSWVVRLFFLGYFVAFLYDFVCNISDSDSKDVSWLAKYLVLPYVIFLFGRLDYTTIIFCCLVHLYVVNILVLKDTPIGSFFLRRKMLLRSATGVATAMMFFIKVSYFPFLLLLPAMLITRLLFDRDFKSIATFLLGCAAGFALIYCSFNVDLKPYIANSLEVIAGYRNTMQMDYQDYYTYSYCLSVLLILLYVCQLWFLRKVFNKVTILVLPIIGLSVYYLFMYSYTRGWNGGFIYNPPLVVLFFYLILYVVQDLKLRARFRNVILLVMLISLANFAIRDILNFRIDVYQILFVKQLQPLAIPQPLVAENDSYDVYPWNTAYCYFNHLHYKPRPGVQAYTDYSPKLDSITSLFYTGRKVDHIIFHGGTQNYTGANAIDNRYFMFDDPLTKLEILKNYRISGAINDSVFISSKRDRTAQIGFKETESVTMNLGEALNVEQLDSNNGVLFFTADFKYASSARLLSLIKRMPNIKADILLANGAVQTFNVGSEFLRNPCVLNRYCANNRDMFGLFNDQQPQVASKVKSIKFYTVTGGYQPQYQLKIYKVSGLQEL